MYKLIRSKRKTVSVEITSDLEVLVRAPLRMKKEDIDRFVAQNSDWIRVHREKRARAIANKLPEPDDAEIAVLKQKAGEILPRKVEYFAELMDVKPRSVKITSAKKRMGSCSADNGICFSYRLMMQSEDVIDYVVIHELAHIKEHNHSKRFYDVVRTYCPDYKDRERRIKW